MLTVNKQHEMSVQEEKGITESCLLEQIQEHEDGLESWHRTSAGKVHKTC
jgi:hypothetical protein